MGIKDMLVREDFYNILRDTIIGYARMFLHKEIQCEYEPFEGADAWRINSELGFVSRTPSPKGLRTYMKSEFNVRGSWLKNLIGTIGVDVITTFPFIGTSRMIYISKGAFNPAVFIIPQNRSIRFYNYKTMTVDCIVKAGFTSKYFDNQAAFREKYHYGFLNPMLEHGEGWFREPVLTGHPLARTTDPELFEKGNAKALHFLKTIARDTLEWIPAKPYFKSLKDDALKKIQLALEKKGIKEAIAANNLIEVAEALVKNVNAMIPTCMSHGDFQSGNIWVEPLGKTLIYDWETAGRRSVWYDSATLSYSLRRAAGWASLLNDATGNGLFLCVPDGIKKELNVKEIMGILLLEDILFYLDDMLELPKEWGFEDFDSFIRILAILNWQL